MKKVLCAGTFDILHEGHIEFLKDIKKKGDYLIIFVISNKAAYSYKKILPKNSQGKRVSNLKKLKIANEIIPVSDNFDVNFKKMEEINPDIFAFGYDQKRFLEKVKKYFDSRKIPIKCYTSKKFAGGIHSSHLRE